MLLRPDHRRGPGCDMLLVVKEIQLMDKQDSQVKFVYDFVEWRPLNTCNNSRSPNIGLLRRRATTPEPIMFNSQKNASRPCSGFGFISPCYLHPSPQPSAEDQPSGQRHYHHFRSRTVYRRILSFPEMRERNTGKPDFQKHHRLITSALKPRSVLDLHNNTSSNLNNSNGITDKQRSLIGTIKTEFCSRFRGNREPLLTANCNPDSAYRVVKENVLLTLTSVTPRYEEYNVWARGKLDIPLHSSYYDYWRASSAGQRRGSMQQVASSPARVVSITSSSNGLISVSTQNLSQQQQQQPQQSINVSGDNYDSSDEELHMRGSQFLTLPGGEHDAYYHLLKYQEARTTVLRVCKSATVARSRSPSALRRDSVPHKKKRSRRKSSVSPAPTNSNPGCFSKSVSVK